MTRLVLVKHAMPQIDEGSPAAEWPLSTDGRAAAARLAHSLGDLGLTRMVSSREPKAVETAAAMREVLRLRSEVEPNLGEHRRETVGFLPRPEFEERMAVFFARPRERVFGEESADEAHDRFALALERLRAPESPLLAVCHGTVITLWVSRRYPVEPMAFWKSLSLPSAVVIEEGAQPRLIGA